MNRIISAVVFFTALNGLTACSSDNDNNDGGTPSATGSPTTGGSGTADAGAGGASGNGGASAGNGTQPAGGSANGADGTGTGSAGTGGTNSGSPGGGGTGAGVVNPGAGNGGGGAAGGGTSAPTQNISNAPAANAEIATDGSGNAIAVWQKHDGTRNNIYYSRFSGGAWSAPALLESLDGEATDPRIAMNNAGNAMVVWAQPRAAGDGPSAWGRYFDAASGWSEPALVNTHTYRRPSDLASNRDVRVAIDDSGSAIAAWIEDSLRVSANGVIANVFRPGSGWGATHVISNIFSEELDVAMDGRGNGVIAFTLDGGGSDPYETYAAYYSATDGFGTRTRLDVGPGNDENPTVAMDAAGNAMVVWSHVTYGAPPNYAVDLYKSRRAPTGEWSVPALIEYDAGFARFPDLAVAENGNAVVVWEHHDGSGVNIRGARFENTVWQLPITIGPGIDPHAAMAGSGPFATYVANDAVMSTGWNGSGWTTPMALETHAETSGFPRIAGSRFASPFYAWLQPSGVWARRLP